MKNKYLLFSFIILLVACEKSDPIVFPEENAGLSLEAIPFVELPLDMVKLTKTKNKGKQQSFFGAPRKDIPVYKIKSKNGDISYTVALKKKKTLSSEKQFDNLVINEYENGDFSSYVIRYEPTKEWLSTSKDFDYYSGKVSFYTVEGRKLSSLQMRNGTVPTFEKEKSQQKLMTKCSLEFQSKVTLCVGGGIVGDEPAELSCTTTYYYEWVCVSGGSTDGGDDEYTNDPEPNLEEIPEGGGGGWTPPIIPEIEDPCEQMEKLENDFGFIERMKDLQSETNLNYETGYLISRDGDEISYTGIAGEADSLGINLSISGTIDGYMHTHYNDPKALSTFSGSDVRAIYQLYQNGNIADHTTFTASVVTAFGTTYSLKIDSITDFLNFGSDNLNTETNFDAFEVDYELYYDGYKIFGEVVGREMALLQLLENSGLTLFKGNSTNFDSWQAIKMDNLSVVNANCN